ALLAGACASPPPAPAPEAAAVPALICPPAPACPAPAVPTPPPAPPIDYRGKLQPGSWMDLPDWRRDRVRPALEAFARGCPVLEKQDAWKSACAGAQTLLPAASDGEIASFFELNFDPHQVINADDSATGMVT